jgi:hypothetical protein
MKYFGIFLFFLLLYRPFLPRPSPNLSLAHPIQHIQRHPIHLERYQSAPGYTLVYPVVGDQARCASLSEQEVAICELLLADMAERGIDEDERGGGVQGADLASVGL